MALVKCKECGNEISKKAKKCPSCGAPQKRTSGFTKVVTFMLVLFAVGWVVTKQESQQLAEEKAKAEQATRAARIQELNSKKAEILAKIDSLLSEGKPAAAVAVTKRFTITGDKDVLEREKTAITSQITEELKTIPATEYKKNLDKYQQLAKLHPHNNMYAAKVNHYQKKHDEKENRKKLIEQQFSQWDGSHRALEATIKKSMHNPDSYEHVETRYSDKGKTLYLVTTIRGTNAFGAVVTSKYEGVADVTTGSLLSYGRL